MGEGGLVAKTAGCPDRSHGRPRFLVAGEGPATAARSRLLLADALGRHQNEAWGR